MDIVKTEDLPLPSIYVGGYIYSRETTGELDEVPIPQSRRSSDPRDDQEHGEEAYEVLLKAPVGAVYIFKEIYDEDQIDHDVEQGEEIEIAKYWIYQRREDGNWNDYGAEPVYW